ncbi:RNA-directed DNA polymerase from mobile element jockey [Plakobranchus ocellatus]|uniref:RNA-directed DNA polymerase from mobile element jockey n=1 Tax=Plakobranchus ocellatus TaxID=259542 RepID=A0AAV3Z7C4_9GAST|nr:RNA-directed DNA polymerase from mobile element jockey [Plakobranchus ocellatus]
MSLDIPVIVNLHKNLNISKGVIRRRDLRSCSEEEMVEELSDITHARGIKVRRDEDKIQTVTVVLAFDSPKPPSRIRQGYLMSNRTSRLQCHRYSHGKDKCEKPAAFCVRCGKGDHVKRDWLIRIA